MKFRLLALLLGASPFLMTGCSGGGANEDLVQYMQDVRQRPARPIEPIPSFPTYKTFIYSAASVRSPFEKPQVIILTEDGQPIDSGVEVKPDLTRPKEYLERFSINAISMVGTMERPDKDEGLWALVDDGTGNVHRVKVGNYMGRNHGRIIGVTSMQISLIEIVPTGTGSWVERPKVLQLVESKGSE